MVDITNQDLRDIAEKQYLRAARLARALERLASPEAFLIPRGATEEETARMRYAQAALDDMAGGPNLGHVHIAHDGFAGDIIGHYITREGKRGVVVQQDGTRVVHVYGEKWLEPAPVEKREA